MNDGHGRDVEITGGPAAPATLEAVWDDAWSRLVRGAAQRNHAFHTCTLATVGEDGADARTVVLRDADRAAGLLRFHTDRRSAKLGQLLHDDRVCLLFYGDSVQVRVRGIARVQLDGAEADAAWQGTHPMSRRCYLTSQAPGMPSAARTSGLPAELDVGRPELATTESGRTQFAVVVVEAQAIDWLHLAASGQSRAGFSRTTDGWMSTWLVP
jgi:pyridoxamine 5'-phosphate oxidase